MIQLPSIIANTASVVTQLAKYLFVLLILLFVLLDFSYFSRKGQKAKNALVAKQIVIIFIFDTLGYVLCFLHTANLFYILMLGGIYAYLFVTLSGYRMMYPKSSMLLVNNMLMLLSIGFVIIGRLDLAEALKQYVIASGATVMAFLVPVIIQKLHFLDKLTWLYAILGIASLVVVLALAVTSRGAKLSISIGGITVQFSEIVKITLVFFMAAKLTEKDPIPFRDVVITTIVAALHVVILVLSTDLGTALVFFIAYIVVIYVATGKAVYPLAGLLGGSGASVCAYFLFNHVRQRVEAWRNPFYNYDTTGYQISQSLFAIGAGGWFGTGLFLGRPETIPVASKDFVFSAICEEFGGVFGIALILICMNTFLLICNISLKIENRFYKLIALGLGAEYGFQVFLTIGGVTKFIPMTGITLPLVSYGGSSVLSTIILLAIIQGLYILREDEGEERERERKRLGY
jgi:cell division protein FtsW (lipid II flippase)